MKSLNGSAITLKQRLNRLRIYVIYHDNMVKEQSRIVEDIRALYNFVSEVREGLIQIRDESHLVPMHSYHRDCPACNHLGKQTAKRLLEQLE